MEVQKLYKLNDDHCLSDRNLKESVWKDITKVDVDKF